MSISRKYYEDLFINSSDNRDLLPRNQELILEMLGTNGAVGVVGLFDEPDYPIYFISGFALTAIGYDFEEMLQVSGGKFSNLIYEKDRQAFIEHFEQRTLPNCEFRMVHSSGKNVWVSFYHKDSVSFDGRSIIVASIRVVDDAKKRESELLDALTKSYNHIIYVDVNQGRYRLIKNEDDDFSKQIIGTIDELQEMLKQYGKDNIRPEDISFAKTLKELNFFTKRGDEGGNYQVTYQAKINGEYQWVQFQAIYGGAMNLDTGHFILTFRIVDDEKKRELDKNRMLSDSLVKAEEARQAKNRFLSRMSHDLRTPINGIVGMLEIANRNKDNPEVMDDCLNKIALSCDTLMSLVNDVLDMSNLDSGKIELEDENVNLYTLVTEELTMFPNRARRSGFTYETHFDESLNCSVIGSPKHILQIFEHLLDNAIKYNKPGGSVIVSGRELSRSEKTALFEFVVEDTGIGMEQDFIRKIFEPFEQENNDARTSYMGTGLGMSIVKILVEQMNGTIEVESQHGEGTKVIVTLPFKLSGEAPVTYEKPERVDFTGVKVLLVEDNEMNMEIAKFLLESVGMIVTCAENGQKAVDIYSRSQPDEYEIILMDIMMPVMDGLDATKEIRKLDRPDAKTVNIIALSANVMDSDIKKSKMAGMDEHLPKPIDTEPLLGAIAKCLR